MMSKATNIISTRVFQKLLIKNIFLYNVIVFVKKSWGLQVRALSFQHLERLNLKRLNKFDHLDPIYFSWMNYS